MSDRETPVEMKPLDPELGRMAMADRMAAVGTLAAGVAHEINNPLAYMIANVSFALDELADHSELSEVVEALREARHGGERIRRIVNDLRTFSRPDADAADVVNLHDVLETTLNLTRNEVRHRARLVKNYPDSPIRVVGSAAQLGQVFVNLVVNAAHAIEEGHMQGNEVRVSVEDAGTGAVVEISDSGKGIPDDDIHRIFEPFFTTKEPGVGVGLGLSVCHGIVTRLGGRITVDSELGVGTTFRVFLPYAEGGSISTENPTTFESTARGKILIIDDDEMVGRSVKRILGSEHDVTARQCAGEALDLIESGEYFDVIICDLMMPEMTGMDFYAELINRFPDELHKVVFLTGGAFTPRARKFLDEVPNPGMHKPFDPKALRELVRSVLGS